MHAFLRWILQALSAPPQPVWKIKPTLYRDGSVRLDVTGFLASEDGQASLCQAQAMWERLHC
jgi:hypothetical protein